MKKTWLKDENGDWDMDAFSIYGDVKRALGYDFETEEYKHWEEVMNTDQVVRKVILFIAKEYERRFQELISEVRDLRMRK